MPGMFQVIQIHCIVDNPFDITFVIPDFHLDFEWHVVHSSPNSWMTALQEGFFPRSAQRLCRV
jgi:hypothetical protein